MAEHAMTNQTPAIYEPLEALTVAKWDVNLVDPWLIGL